MLSISLEIQAGFKMVCFIIKPSVFSVRGHVSFLWYSTFPTFTLDTQIVSIYESFWIITERLLIVRFSNQLKSVPSVSSIVIKPMLLAEHSIQLNWTYNWTWSSIFFHNSTSICVKYSIKRFIWSFYEELVAFETIPQV